MAHRIPKPRKFRVLEIGSISEGTLKVSDMMPTLLDLGERLLMGRKDRGEFIKVRNEWNQLVEDVETSAEEGEMDVDIDTYVPACDMFDEMIELLNSYTPDYTYLGMHHGDGANLGVWPMSELLDNLGTDEEVDRSDELPVASKVKQDHWLVVNDHGNCTLYRKVRWGRAGYRWVECWSVV